MYFVTGLRPELSVDLKGIPNKRFFTKLQLLRLGDLEEKVFEELISKLPDYFHFHGPHYSRKVYNQSFLLSRAEEIEQDERLLVRSAALMLYTGLSQSYAHFENRSVVIARDLLPEFKYSEKQIDQICNLILSTKAPFKPNNLLEKIMIDARMEFIGGSDYPEKAKLLYHEMREAGIKINGPQFKRQQQELLHEFEFFTTAARRLREVSGEEQMTALESERWI
jgi:pentatricopeptide repeat protein